jgi:Cu(I)/Ag(I) efflux system membrane fusion protein
MRWTTIATLLAMLLAPASALADTAQFDRAMQPIVEQYLTIHEALAGDTTKGVGPAAKKIVKLSKKLDPNSVSGEHAAHYASLPKKIADAAGTLAKAKKIADAREAFKRLSRPLSMWVTMSKPKGLNVIFCSMAKGSWLQKDAKVRNPYYGAKMLRCGEIIEGQHKGKASGHMHKAGKGGHMHKSGEK